MHWIVAGLIAGVVVFLADWVLWGKVFTKGMEALHTPIPPERMKQFMAGAMPKTVALSLIFGVLLALLYKQLQGGLWATGQGALAGMEFATILWLPTIALQTIGNGVWYDKVRPLLMATFWAWLIRMNVAGIVVGLLVK